VDNLTDLLVKGNILVRIDQEGDNDKALQPARDIGNLTVNSVVAAMEDVGAGSRALARLPDTEMLAETLTALRSELDQSPANRLLRDV
jgi:hypothetical protein